MTVDEQQPSVHVVYNSLPRYARSKYLRNYFFYVKRILEKYLTRFLRLSFIVYLIIVCHCLLTTKRLSAAKTLSNQLNFSEIVN